MRELFSRAPENLITIAVARNLEFGAFAAGLFLRDATGIRYWNAGGELAARALSPGILLFAHGLQMAISERKQTFDFSTQQVFATGMLVVNSPHARSHQESCSLHTGCRWQSVSASRRLTSCVAMRVISTRSAPQMSMC